MAESTETSGAESSDGPPDKKPETPPISQWNTAVDRYRESSKWAIGAFAAIGALLAGTAPLAGIGGVDIERLPAVVAGGALGLFGVGVAIAATVATLVPRTVYWHEVKGKKQGPLRRLLWGLGPLEHVLHNNPGSVLPPGLRTVTDLETGIANLRKLALKARRDATRTDLCDAEKERLQALSADYHAQLEQYEASRLELMRIGRFEKARTGFRVALAAMTAGSLAAGIGLGLLLFGVSDQTSADKSAAEITKIRAEADKLQAEAAKVSAEIATTTTTAPQTATAAVRGSAPSVSIRFTEAGKKQLADLLGPGCDLTNVQATALAGDSSTGTWDVVTQPGTQCRALRITVTPKLGSVATGE